VGGGIGSHLLEPRPGAPLVLGSPSLRGAGAIEALDQVVANLLQLGHVGHVPLGAEKGMCGFPGLSRIGGICRELCLEVGDLTAELLAPEPLVGFDGRHLGLARRHR